MHLYHPCIKVPRAWSAHNCTLASSPAFEAFIPHIWLNNSTRYSNVTLHSVLPLQTNSRFWTSATLWPLRCEGPMHWVYKPTRGLWRSQSESQARWQSQYRLFECSRLKERKEVQSKNTENSYFRNGKNHQLVTNVYFLYRRWNSQFQSNYFNATVTQPQNQVSFYLGKYSEVSISCARGPHDYFAPIHLNT